MADEAINTQETAKRVIGKPFQPGNSGKPKGAVNHLTKTVKETVLQVFNELQDDPAVNLTAFAKKYPKDFYLIAAKLIPTDIKADLTATLNVEPITGMIFKDATDVRPESETT